MAILVIFWTNADALTAVDAAIFHNACLALFYTNGLGWAGLDACGAADTTVLVQTYRMR